MCISYVCISYEDIHIKPKPLHGAVSFTGKIHKSRNQVVEIGVVLVTITPSDPLEQFLFPVPPAFDDVGLEVLIPSQGSLSLKLAQ